MLKAAAGKAALSELGAGLQAASPGATQAVREAAGATPCCQGP